ncbi:MAG TPA: cupin domain-containing protein [Steroidobacteraceae bacterium]|nr:cupin domain-containing protein [Steroidobacteraceae bacterium]
MAGSLTLEQFERELPQRHLAPLWRVLAQLAPAEPMVSAVPWHWHGARLAEELRAAGQLISAAEAERRVLVLENPGLPGQSRITPSLYAGVQLILPGEVARSHRHAAAALRLVLEGEGAETSVEDERIAMRPGDFIITPSWAFHGHANPGAEPVSWLDGLDVPIVSLLSATFTEPDPRPRRAAAPADGDALARFGSGLVPLDFERRGARLPLCYYPYERTREALEVLRKRGPWDEHRGLALAFVDPTSGGPPMPTIGTFMQLLPSGFAGARYRATDGAVFAVLEGEGRVEFSERSWDLRPRDVFTAPPWSWYRLSATADLVLFGFSDLPLQRHLGLWREERE